MVAIRRGRRGDGDLVEVVDEEVDEDEEEEASEGKEERGGVVSDWI